MCLCVGLCIWDNESMLFLYVFVSYPLIMDNSKVRWVGRLGGRLYVCVGGGGVDLCMVDSGPVVCVFGWYR